MGTLTELGSEWGRAETGESARIPMNRENRVYGGHGVSLLHWGQKGTQSKHIRFRVTGWKKGKKGKKMPFNVIG